MFLKPKKLQGLHPSVFYVVFQNVASVSYNLSLGLLVDVDVRCTWPRT